MINNNNTIAQVPTTNQDPLRTLEQEIQSLKSDNSKIPMLEETIKSNKLSLDLYAELKSHDDNEILSLSSKIEKLEQQLAASEEKHDRLSRSILEDQINEVVERSNKDDQVIALIPKIEEKRQAIIPSAMSESISLDAQIRLLGVNLCMDIAKSNRIEPQSKLEFINLFLFNDPPA